MNNPIVHNVIKKIMTFYTDALWVMGIFIKLSNQQYNHGNWPPSWVSKWPPWKPLRLYPRPKPHRNLMLVSKSTFTKESDLDQKNMICFCINIGIFFCKLDLIYLKNYIMHSCPSIDKITPQYGRVVC